MPARVDWDVCDGCRGSPEPPCVRVCPGDIVAKDFEREKSYLRCPAECWDCYACAKACPRGAIQVELPYALARRKGRLLLLEHGTDGVLWQIRWPDGRAQNLLRPAHIPTLPEGEVAEDVFLGKGI